MIMINNKEIGDYGENLAAEYLRDKGFEILEQNYRYSRNGEIDIIARKNDYLVFFEVKSRSGDAFGGPLYSISGGKKNTLKKIAHQYISTHQEICGRDTVCRFDLIAVQNGRIEWVEDIIR